MIKLLAIGIGGFIGALLRYGISGRIWSGQPGDPYRAVIAPLGGPASAD